MLGESASTADTCNRCGRSLASMTLIFNEPSPLQVVATPSRRPMGGGDRRIHHRRRADLVWVLVDGGWYEVHDLSLGGLALDRPVDDPGIGSMIDGEIHSRAAGRRLRCSFRATVVRLDDGDGGARIGVAFAPMEAEQIDGLLSIMSAVEREYVRVREAAQRRHDLRRRLRRLAVAAVVAVAAAAAGYAAWMVNA